MVHFQADLRGRLRHTSGIDSKVACERLGHGEFIFTVQTYQHTLPPMHTDAARVIEVLLTPPGTENPKIRKAG